MVDGSSQISAALYYLQEFFTAWEIKGALAALAAFFGTESSLFSWMLIMLFLDLGFGLVSAFRRHRFSCRKLGRGVLKIPCYCVYILLAGAVDSTLTTAIGVNTPLLELLVSYLVATDAVSCLGHMVRLGLPVPSRLRQLLVYARCKVDREIDEICETADRHEQPAAEAEQPKRRGRKRRDESHD